jgi:hypothetical protein
MEMAQADQRDATYVRERITPETITVLSGRRPLPDAAEVCYYSLPEGNSMDRSRPAAQIPIVLCSVDICLNGCLEREMLSPLVQVQGHQFAYLSHGDIGPERFCAVAE